MTVFRVLFNMWKDFSSFRSSINDENLLKVLDKRLSQHRAEVKAKKEASERRKLAKQEAERKRKEKEEKEKKELKSMEQLMR
jgi:sulfur relay (sulfurtransferase) complex TusBCD TusD component (DsrE family)